MKMDIEPMPWQLERDPEKALEKIFETIASEWWIIEEFDPLFRRKIVFDLNPEFNPKKVYPKSYEAEGIVF